MQKKNAPCKFWAQGSCKNGQSCSFQHIGPPGGNAKPGKTQNFQNNNRFAPLTNQSQQNQSYGGNFGNQRGNNTFGNQSQPNQQQNEGATTDQQIIQDLQIPPIWQYSCYGHERCGKCDFEGDVSSEELRWEAYQQQKNYGNMNQYNNLIQNLQQQLNAKKTQFLNQLTSNPSSILGTQQSSSMSSSFGQPILQPSAFGGSVFGNTSPAPSSFGNSSSFGNTTPPSSFGNNSSFGTPTSSSFAPSSSVFGSAPLQSSTFSTMSTSLPSTGGSVFGSSSGSVFGNSAPTSQPSMSSQPATGSVFGGSSFGSAPQQSTGSSVFGSSLFGNSAPISQPSISSQPATGSVFGNAPISQPSMISQPATGSVFGNSSSSFATSSFGGSAFGSNSTTSSFGSSSAPSSFGTGATGSVFGNTSSFSSAFGSLTAPQTNNQIPTKTPSIKIELTQKETEAFVAPKFKFGEIPEVPPPLEYV